MGLAGLAAYLALLVTSIRKMIRSAGKRPYVMAIAFAVICYAAQAAVNISVPIVTPVMLMLLAMGVSGDCLLYTSWITTAISCGKRRRGP